MDSEAERAYVSFKEQMKRNIYLDNLSPQVNDAVIKSALDQYGSVTKIQFIPNYVEPYDTACSALVELENPKQAASIVDELTAYPFMISGMPRPVRAQLAKAEMFEERPAKPGRMTQISWVDPDDPDFEASQTLKTVAKKHLAEAAYLRKCQLEEEERLSRTQDETLNSAYCKYEMIDKLLNDDAKRLAQHYNNRRSSDDPAGY